MFFDNFIFLILTSGYFFTFIHRNNATIVPIGGIFEDKPNEDDEIAFRAAIDLLNEEKLYAPLKFKPAIVHIVPENVIHPRTGEIINVQWDLPFTALTAACSLLNQGVAGILTASYENNANIIQSMCDEKEMPFIRASDDVIFGRECCSINVFPNLKALAKTAGDLVYELKWTNFTIIYETFESLSQISQLLQMYNSTGYSVVLFQIHRTADLGYRNSFKKLRSSNQTQFIIHCEIENMQDVLEHMQQVGLMMKKYKYLILNFDTHTLDFEQFGHSKASFITIQLVDPTAPKTIKLAQAIINKKIEMGMEVKNYNASEAAWKVWSSSGLLVDSLYLLAEAFREILSIDVKPLYCNTTSSWEHGSTIYNYMKLKIFNGQTGLVRFDHLGQRSDFSLNIMQLQDGSFRKIGTWTTNEAVKFDPLYLNSLGLGDLHNTTLTALICWSEPYAFYKNDSAVLKGNDQFEGFVVDIMKEIAIIAGFSYKLVRNKDDKNGDFNETTQEWNGMIGDILNDVGDIAIGDLTVTKLRQQYVDFTTPFMSSGIKILFKKPLPVPNFFAFADPFAIEIWIGIVISYFTVSVILFVTAHISPPEWENWNPCDQNPRYITNQFSLKNSFWYMLGALMQQGAGDLAPRGFSTRILSSTWAFFILIIVSYYKAQLAAFLTIEMEELPFNTMEELVNKGEKLGIRYGAVSNEATHMYFKESPNPLHQKIAKYMDAHPQNMVDENWEGYLLLEEGSYAFFTDSVFAQFITKILCYMTSIDSQINERQFAIAMKKDSPYRYTLSNAILKLQERNTILELQKKWWSEKFVPEECKGSKSTALKALTLHHVAGIFWITIGFILLSSILVFFELAVHVYYRSRKQKKNFLQEFKKEILENLKFKSIKKR